MQERDTLKVINHWQKISRLVPLVEPWFDKLLLSKSLRDLAQCGYNIVNWDMINAFVERWHHEMSLFHLPHGEMMITLDDVTCLLHILIRGTFSDHERIGKEEALDMLVEKLGVTPESAMAEIDKTRGCHVRYSYLDRVFRNEIRRAREACGYLKQVSIHQRFAMRAYILYLVGINFLFGYKCYLHLYHLPTVL